MEIANLSHLTRNFGVPSSKMTKLNRHKHKEDVFFSLSLGNAEPLQQMRNVL